MTLPPDFIAALRQNFRGDIRLDLGSRVLYSTDASIYQIEPQGVVLPRNEEDLQAVVELAARFSVPILPRGAGTSLAGQAIGPALILDCSRWLDQIIEVNPEAATATVQPGVVLANLNRIAGRHGLMFGPDPASAERATMGGVVANNATGAHSILYGMAADHLVSAEVVMADGSLAALGEVDLESAQGRENGQSLAADFLQTALKIRAEYADDIRSHYPQTWRNSAGYRLNYLLPWSASRPPRWETGGAAIDAGGSGAGASAYPPLAAGHINLAHLLAGSEGTLAVMRRMTLRLVKKPKATALAVLAFPSVAEACDEVPRLLEKGPSAIELIPGMLIRLARGIPAFAAQLGWVNGDPPALLVVEFSGDDLREATERAERCGPAMRVAITTDEQEQIWNVRKAGLGILDASPTKKRPVAFIEDCAIPVEKLGAFVREVERILLEHETEAGFYAHASAGCLHIRPIMDLRTGIGVEALRLISEAVLMLTLRLGGAMASEHGDGLARSEWLQVTYGEQIMEATARLKGAADPKGILNPGKILAAPPMDTALRFGRDYRGKAWRTDLDFSRVGGLEMAIEQCNGQGVCRKDAGVMCPSFQATHDEMFSTRGRANLLRALTRVQATEGKSAAEHAGLIEASHQALDLCLACKGCKAECPSGVDMAKIKFAFEAEYYATHRRPLSDYLFGYFHVTASLLAPIAPVANLVTHSSITRKSLAAATGITQRRPFPDFVRKSARPRGSARGGGPEVIFLRDPFTRFVEPRIEQAAFDILEAMGVQVHMLPMTGAGAGLLSKGFIRAARKHAERVLNEVRKIDPAGKMPVVGIEPPEIYCFKHDYVDLLPNREAEIRGRMNSAWLLEECLLRLPENSTAPLPITGRDRLPRVKFHPHCHQRAEPLPNDGMANGVNATVELLRRCGYEVDLIEAGCCGMAGTFGYESHHFELSQAVAELKLFPALREALASATDGMNSNLIVASSGSACRLQISQGLGVPVAHPMELLKALL